MPSQAVIPPLLSDQLNQVPECSLTLLTSVLGASSNWLLLRFLHVALTSGKVSSGESKNRVILVSWLGDPSFWKEGSKKLGTDLTKSSYAVLIDGLGAGFGTMNRGIEYVQKEIQNAMAQFKGDGFNVVTILDGINLLLAATETSNEDILDFVGDLREVLLPFL